MVLDTTESVMLMLSSLMLVSMEPTDILLLMVLLLRFHAKLLKLTFPQIHWPKVRVVRQVVSNFVHKERFLIYKVILGNVRVFSLLEVISDAYRQYNFPSTLNDQFFWAF